MSIEIDHRKASRYNVSEVDSAQYLSITHCRFIDDDDDDDTFIKVSKL